MKTDNSFIFGAFNFRLLVILGLLDIFLGGFLAFGLIRGLKNGLFVELGTFVSLMIGLYAATKFSHYAAIFLRGHVSWSPTTIQTTAFILTFALVVLGISLLATFLTTIASFAHLGIINTLAGGLLGMLKIALIVSVCLSFFEKVNVDNFFVKKETIASSLFYNPIKKTGFFIAPVVENGWKTVKEKAM